MRNILILGAGKSSSVLIDYLVEHSQQEQWQITVADITDSQALQKTKSRKNTIALGFDLNNADTRKQLISKADIAISMLPAALHLAVAKDCLQLKKNLVTPSYISAEMKALNEEVAHSGLLFMNEMGLDPGLDHLSAVQILDKLRAAGKRIIGFESHCGGLIAPESDYNPWHYKFTWNPRNVILAGQGEGGIHYLKDGQHIDFKYEELFNNTIRLEVEGHGTFESYPNRDSLKYISEYGLDNVKTMYRGTLRIPPFCRAWSELVNAGFTNDKQKQNGLSTMSFKSFFASKILEAKRVPDPVAMELVSDIFNDNRKIPFDTGTAAQVLQNLLEEKWQMKPGDKDMVVMVHRITYEDRQEKKCLQSSLVNIGKDTEHTAMATTVGLPVAMVTKMILNNKISRRGVLMPKYPEIYNPILAELKEYGIEFKEVNE